MASAPDGQIVLEEEVDENYEPSQQEILEYAQWLGMDAEKEKASIAHVCSHLITSGQLCAHRF